MVLMIRSEIGEWPRRNRLDHNSTEELAIRRVIDQVEGLGADVLLTEAVQLLDAAREKLADWVDAQHSASDAGHG